ncbi:hypothetical protein F3J44_24180 [Pantoea sp. Tr-811]|uniref:hypothetical protein n=1 Tax=Pantoea sp. Tr-811 TaxID=2608361 RepID=UPI001420D2F6|nr:hypothetical protein [Pantoea sp. Tr-811]NIF29453.1 hypothetical protein [Pantoea sp. Tr-811]
MKASNLYRWQQDRIQHRLAILEASLLDLDQRRVKFKQVTYLAKYIADAISTAERLELERTNKMQIKISETKSCRASSLLKSKSYRPLLDSWIRRNNIGSLESHEIADLRLKLVKLSNEHSIALDEIRTLQEIHNTKNHNSPSTSERNDGMTIAQMLISHFKEFCEIQDGALIEPSPGRPTIVPANLFSAYIKWASALY